MRVMLVGDTVGGVFTYVAELAAALAARGVETAVALMGGPLAPDQRRALRRARVERLFAAEFALEWMEDPWRDVERAGRWLLEIEECVQPDVVHLNGFAHGSLPWRAPLVVGAHSCVVSWYEAVRGHEPPPAWDRYREEVRRGLAGASLVVAPTRAMAEAIVRHYAPPAETVVIPNGRRRSGLVRPKEPFVLGAGRMWDEAKNLTALDRAAAGLDWPVLVAGDAEGAAERARHVRLLGRLGEPALAEQMARAAIFAAPARYEPFGLAPLEAALAGCALVVGDIPSLREVWGDSALYADPDGADELRAQLRRLSEDPLLRDRCAAAAGRRARQYTSARMAAGILDAYERAATAALDEPARAVGAAS